MDLLEHGESIGEPVVADLSSYKDANVKVGDRYCFMPNTIRMTSDGQTKQGRFFLPYGCYVVKDVWGGSNYTLQRVAQQRGSTIFEGGASKGSLTSSHLRSLPIFEAILDRALAAQNAKFSPASRTVLSASATVVAPVQKLRCAIWGLVFEYLSAPCHSGVFTFEFDKGLLDLVGTCRDLKYSIATHPLWITRVLGLEGRHVGAILARPSLTCLAAARYLCLNAARLPDIIRNDPNFRNVLRPWTRHKIGSLKARAVQADVELPPKMHMVQLLGTFLISEPQYRGDTEKDTTSGEMFALCEMIAKEDPLFVLKLAHYVRHILTFRNTTNFLLALAVKIESCRPFVRTALPACTNLPTDLLELWDFWRKLSGKIQLPACLKKGFADKFAEFGEYQLGKYINAKVPKPQNLVIVAPTSGKSKGKGSKSNGRGSAALNQLSPQAEMARMAEAAAKMHDPVKRPLTLKSLIRAVHAGKGREETVCKVLGKRYPCTEDEFFEMHLDEDGKNKFDPERAGERLRIPIPQTWETQCSEKGNLPEVWEELVRTNNLPFMAMLKNLRNILMAGVNEETHDRVLGRLKSDRQIASSKQMPVRFLSAFEAIDFDEATLVELAKQATSKAEYIEEEKTYGSGKQAKKVVHRRRVCKRPPTKELLDRYRDALEIAVSLAASLNVPPLECPSGGKALVLVDVSGSMEAPLTQGPKKVHDSALTPHRRSTGRPIVEGQDFDLEDYFAESGQRSSRKLSISQTWIGRDLDLSCNIMNKEGQAVANVSYQNLAHSEVWHSGDITDAPYGAEEIITVDLDKLPESAFMLTFTVNSFSGETFDAMQEAAISLRDDGLEGDSAEGTQEICAFRLTGKSKAVVACCLVKKERGWCFRCLNTPQDHGATIQTLLGKIKKEFDAIMADSATKCKRLVDSAMLLALCIRARLGDDKCTIVLFSGRGRNDEPGYVELRGLGPRILGNMRRAQAIARTMGRGTEIPIEYLQQCLASRDKLDHVILLSDGLVAPAKHPEDAFSLWLEAYRMRIQPVSYACVDLLGLGKPQARVGGVSDKLISGYSEAVLRYLAQDSGAQLAEIEAIQLPAPKEPRDNRNATSPLG